jgi:hypothetical protein
MMERKMTENSKVKFHAQTIVAKIQLGKLMLGVADFSRTPITAARARTSVEFEAGISREEAMAGLTALLKEIEAHGLPETSLSIHSEHARKFDRMLEYFAAAKRQYDRLSSRGRQRWREYCALKNQREGGISPTFSEELFRFYQWRSEADVEDYCP